MAQLWNNTALPKRDDAIKKYTSLLLLSQNPYNSLLQKEIWPSNESLIETSSLLSAVPGFKKREDALDIAKSEYCHYVAQTYFFELLGFQIISGLATSAERPEQIHAFMSQAADEARHVQAYAEVVMHLPSHHKPVACIPRLYERIVKEASFPEKVILGLVVLESLAIGVFAARTKLYAGGPSYQLDLQALREESQHHQDATRLVCSMLKENRINIGDVRDIVKQGIHEISSDLLPLEVAKQFGIGLTDKELKQLNTTGFVGMQANITRTALTGALRSFIRMEKQIKKEI